MALALVQVGNTKINPNMVSEDLVDEAIEKFGGLGLKDGAVLRERVKALGEHLTEKISEDALCKCSKCGAPNDATEPSCPFCGHVDGEPVVEAKPAENYEITDILVEDAPPEKTKKNGKNGAAAHALVKKVPAEISKPTASDLVKVDAAKLDAAVERILNLKGDFAVVGYQIGKELGEIVAKNLWKTRTNPEGNLAYKKFGEFCRKELGFSDVHAKRFVDIAANYDEEQFRKLGVQNLMFLLAAPEPKKAASELIQEAGGAKITKKDVRHKVEQLVQEYEEEHGEAPARARGPRISPEKTTRASSAKKPEKSEVTVAHVLGKGIKTFLFQGKGQGAKSATLASLKKGAVALGEYELKNNVVMHIELCEAKDGQLYVVEKPKRV